MEQRRIGSLTVSVVGLGCNQFGRSIGGPETDAVVGAALEVGVNFFDTADSYGGTHSEELLGGALGRRRDEVVIATKFGSPYEGHEGGGAPAYVARALDDSLRRLRTDRIDIYQLHQPDPRTPIADTLGALSDAVAQGKVREIGCSNFDAAQLQEAARATRAVAGGASFVSVQNEYNVLQRAAEREVIPECERAGLAFLPYFPLAYGLLTGKYRAGEPVPAGTRLSRMPAASSAELLSVDNLARVACLQELAESTGHSVLDLAVAWLLSSPVVASVIAGATRPEQVRQNAAAGRWTLPPELVTGVDDLAPA
jgi:aryl-alcohol dehydrogenase-like predicted oxidoreductase